MVLAQLAPGPALYNERLAVVLGFVTLVAFVGMGMTCRNFVSLAEKVGFSWLTKSKPYRALFRMHSVFWYALATVLLLHVSTGILHTGLPVPGEPDAFIHLFILVFAGSVLVTLGLTLSNCRIFASLLRVFKGDSLFTGAYRPFYRLHALFWVSLIAALVGHLVISYVHVGVWPAVAG